MSAELAQFEGALAVEIGWDIEPAGEEQVTTHASPRDAAHGQRLPCSDVERRMQRNGFAIELRAEIGTGQA